MKANGNTILITGGASGIGRELAERFQAQDNTVIIAGRRRERLDEVIAANEGMVSYVLDVGDKADIEAFAATVVAEHPGLNVLINNAGIMTAEDVTCSRDMSDAEATVTTNLLGPIRLTNALIDHLMTKPDAAVINLSSGLAFVPLVSTPTYCATKAAIHSYTVSLRDALKGRVEVIELVPPAVQTELTPGQSTRAGYMPLDAFMAEVMTLFALQPTPPEILVERVGVLRFAEAEKRFDQTLASLNDAARKAHAQQG
ncbi:SDR family oxidoreductase [Methylobacterium sp. J-048]|uniref:SDR family oxidoreductase n=1 Tax=Methylobacterium sp. J-048 TaxID=2836635 RepID=UPI001FB88245|nr:SDR family oxidoreductase [Methylobacterium sp. J-048]MCJ2057160.1 SDR family oxidoreductase [Methylobacterium sp. J-048]